MKHNHAIWCHTAPVLGTYGKCFTISDDEASDADDDEEQKKLSN